ncbi:beta strand repeat-containing protein [Candidatus Bipolaricaulota bacterium]
MVTRGDRSSGSFHLTGSEFWTPRRRRPGALAAVLAVTLLVGCLSIIASAADYVDYFTVNPINPSAPTQTASSVVTGTAAIGLSYVWSSTGDGGDFLWSPIAGDGGSGHLSGQSTTWNSGTTEKFTLESRDGKAFVFDSVWLDIVGDGVWVTGKGPEPFSFFANTLNTTHAPTGGSKLVTEVEFSSTDFYQDFFDTVNVELDVPGAGIYGAGNLIENGDPSPSTSDDTDMGSTSVGSPITKTFTISSIGDLPLDLTGGPYVDFSSNPSGDFSVTAQPTVDPIAAGSSDTFTIQFNPSSSGVKTATVSIDNNSEADPYTFSIEGEGSGAPEIGVTRGGIPIGDPGTDAQGSKNAGTQVTLTYTVENTGNATLTVSNITGTPSGNVTVDEIDPTVLSIAASNSDTFTVKYTPIAAGAFSFALAIDNTDVDEDPYDITVSGTGVDVTKPDVTIEQAGGQGDPTNGSPISFDVVFTETVIGFETGDVTVGGSANPTTGEVTGSGATYTVAVSGMGNDGTVTTTIPAGMAQDAASNTNNASTSFDNEVTYDATPPTISIGAPSVTDTASGPVTYTVTYGGADSVTLGTGDITLNKTGSADGTVGVSGSGTTTRTVTISAITGDGTLGISVSNTGTATDDAGNPAPTAGPSTTFNVDNTPPTIAIGAPSVADTTSGPVTYTVTYGGADAVTLGTGDITLNKTGSANGTVGVSGSGTVTRTVTISAISGDGTLGISVSNTGTATDDAGNPAPTAGPSATFNVDNTPPTIAIGAPSLADTNSGPVTYTVTYGGADTVTLSTGDITLNKTGSADGTVGVSGSGTAARTVTISAITGEGTLGITVSNTGTGTDNAGNITPTAGPSATFNVDNTPPTDPTPSSTSHSTSTWDNDSTIDVRWSGASDAMTSVAGYSYSWDTNPSGVPDTVQDLAHTADPHTSTSPSLADGANHWFHVRTVDAVGNWTSTEHLGPFQIDATDPSVPTGLSPANGTSTNDTTPVLSWNASTDTGGSGIRTTSAYRIMVTGPVNRDTYVSDTDYNPTLSEGTFTWKVYARDNAGNSSSYTSDTTLYIDATKPDVTIDQAGGQADPTNASPVVFTAVFDEPIDDATFANADVSVGGTAATGAVTITEIAPMDHTTFSVSIVVTGDGTVVPTLPAGGVEDPAGNTNTASTHTDNTVTYDGTPPDVTINQAGGQADPTNVSPVVFTALFNEAINDATFTNADVSVGGTATTGAVTVTEVAPNDDTTFEVSIVVTVDGTVVPTLPAGGVEDSAGNTNTASTHTDNSVTVDTDPPGVKSRDILPAAVITDAEVGACDFAIIFVYDEPMDMTVAPTLTFPVEDPSGTIPTICMEHWQIDTRYLFAFSVVDANVEIDDIDVRVTGAQDVAGNVQLPYDEADVFDIDTLNPWVVGVTVDTNPVYEGDRIQFVTVTFSEAMRDNDTADPVISFSHGATWTSNGDGAYDGADTVWTETFTLTDNDEEFYDRTPSVDVVTVDVTGAKDAAGNDQEDYTPQTEFDIDTLQPTLIDATSTSPDACYTTGASIDVTLTFSEEVRSHPFGFPDFLRLVLDSGGARASTYHVAIDDMLISWWVETVSTTYTVAADENSCDLTLLSYSAIIPSGLFDWAGNVIDYVGPPAGSNIADHNDIVVDTTIPVAVQDPNGNEDRTGSNDSTIVDVRSDPYGQYRLTVRENTPVYIDVKFNDTDLPCSVLLRIHDIPQPPANGSAWFDDPAGNIRYAPDEDYVGPDQFTYQIYDACNNISLEETVYVEVVPLLVVEDQYLATCVDEPLEIDVTVADLFAPEEEFTFTLFDGPFHGVIVGDLDDLEEGFHGLTTAELETLTASINYVPAAGYAGLDHLQIQVVDAFGGEVIVWIDIAVGGCRPPDGGPPGPDIHVSVGDILPIVLPLSFESIHDTAWATVTLTDVETGISYAGALSAVWSEGIGRFVLSVDSTGIPPGEYILVIPLGNDETVTLVIEVGES